MVMSLINLFTPQHTATANASVYYSSIVIKEARIKLVIFKCVLKTIKKSIH